MRAFHSTDLKGVRIRSHKHHAPTTVFERQAHPPIDNGLNSCPIVSTISSRTSHLMAECH